MVSQKVLYAIIALLLVGCADDKAVNAAFFQGQTSWYRFEGTSVVRVNGFESEPALAWTPRYRAQFATDATVVPFAKASLALAVSNLGLMVLSDEGGQLEVTTPESAQPLDSYRTGRIFLYDQKVFFHLYKEPLPGSTRANGVPISLGWWKPGQTRVAFYPIPSQVSDPLKQAVALTMEAGVADLLWKKPQGDSWGWSSTRLTLSSGTEKTLPLEIWNKPQPLINGPGSLEILKEKLSSRLGDDLTGPIQAVARDGAHFNSPWPEKKGNLPVSAALGGPSNLLMAGNGIAAVAQGEDVHIFRFPDLGPAGKYTLAAPLTHGFLVCWELSWRGYTGPAGFVYIPYDLLKF